MTGSCCSQPAAVSQPVPAVSELRGCSSGCCDGETTQDQAQAPAPAPAQAAEAPTEGPVVVDAFEICAEAAAEDDSQAPSCCSGKVNPCCDISCIDRIALRRCGDADHGVACNGATADGKACESHSTSALDAYSAILQKLGCICRSLIALGEKTCCDVRDAHSMQQGKSAGPSPALAAAARSSLDSVSSSRSSGSLSYARAARGPVHQRKGMGVTTDTPTNAKAAPDNTSCLGTCCPTSTSSTQDVAGIVEPAGRLAETSFKAYPRGSDSCCSPKVACCPPVERRAVAELSKGPCCGTKEKTEKASYDAAPAAPCLEVEDKEKDVVLEQDADICSVPTMTSDACCKLPKAAGTAKQKSVDNNNGACCGEKKVPKALDPCADACRESREPAGGTGQASSCVDACCENEEPEEETEYCADACCGNDQPAKQTASCVDACCEGDEPVQKIESCADVCCGEVQPAKVTESCDDSYCDEGEPAEGTGSCADACCSAAEPVPVPNLTTEAKAKADADFAGVADVENHAAGKEHVALSISGMTCTGCETKLSRTLAVLPAVRDLKTSLVLSRAEFNLDLRLGSVDEVIKHLERTTEFKCERVQNQGSFSIDFLVPDNALAFTNQSWPDGVTDMQAMDKQRVRVTFDPKVVGARDLAEKPWDTPVTLAPQQVDASLEAGSRHVRHMGWMTLFSAALTIPVLVLEWAPLPEREVAYSSASLALATVVQVAVAGPFYPKAIKALVFSRVIEMDLLIVLSTSAAYIFSVVSFGYLIAKQPLSTGQFFETSTLLVTLIMVGRWVAALSRQRAVESISIRSLQTPTAILVDGDTGAKRTIDARLLQYGDVFKVLPDTRVPTDGTVMSGSSEADESMLTGESRPVEKHPKSAVIAGSINSSGVLVVRVNRLPGDNTISAIAAMVDEAKLSKPRLQGLSDQIASYFVPVVVMLTIITFVIWVALGITVRKQSGAEATIQAITYAITVLIVSCPCAIGLAVPMVVVIASGVAAEKGIIFKSAEAIEVAHKTSHVVFDKTGTLTRGKLSVAASEHAGGEDKLPLLLGLIESSRHPVSAAVASHLRAKGVTAQAVLEPKSLTGKGMESISKGRTLQAGHSRWLGVSAHKRVQPMLAQGYTVFCFVVDGELQAVFGLEDELRSDAAATVESLQERGISVHVVSGDDDGAVQSCASKLGIAAANVRSRASPRDKQDYISMLLGKDGPSLGSNDKTNTTKSKANTNKAVVVFCGDGTNDAAALARATIGVHMNEGTDVAQSAADVVLMRPLLRGILTMMEASRLSVNRIRFNFAWSFVYNTFAVLLAAGAFVSARIPPEYAGLGELVSVLPVIAAAVLLRWSKL